MTAVAADRPGGEEGPGLKEVAGTGGRLFHDLAPARWGHVKKRSGEIFLHLLRGRRKATRLQPLGLFALAFGAEIWAKSQK